VPARTAIKQGINATALRIAVFMKVAYQKLLQTGSDAKPDIPKHQEGYLDRKDLYLRELGVSEELWLPAYGAVS